MNIPQIKGIDLHSFLSTIQIEIGIYKPLKTAKIETKLKNIIKNHGKHRDFLSFLINYHFQIIL